MMGKRSRQLVVVAFLVLLLPAMAHAQASITGIVRDSSGAVLPGVTVEASSPALIEKLRTAVTDGSGQYRIVDLRPGAYTVTFTIPGFSTVKRDNIALSGAFVASINADPTSGRRGRDDYRHQRDARGGRAEHDARAGPRQGIDRRASHQSEPYGTGRSHPGVTSNTQDVGGSTTGAFTDLTTHGGRASDQRQMVSGVSIGNFNRDGNQATVPPSLNSVQEVAVDTGGVNAEIATGGVRVNFIPRDGGNQFAGSLFITGANTSMQADNLTTELKALGVAAPTKIENQLDVNPAFGGPVMRDKLWFWFAVRYFPSTNFVGNNFSNLNAGNPSAWTYAPDLASPATSRGVYRNVSLRLTWQVTTEK